MRAVVFCGPSLADEDLSRFADIAFLPPARQGDVYHAARRKPRAIGLIDGYFDGQPAVWHKEILWAMSQGIAVFGAASMGALRAAELHKFGMRGIGDIFASYRDGLLTDDDEVALIHGPAETGYLPLSEPMVNLRATFARAVAAGQLNLQLGQRMIAEAKQLFYRERSLAAVIAAAEHGGSAVPAELSAWLQRNRVDQKRADALALLQALAAFLAEPAASPLPADWRFEWTAAWDRATWRTAPADEWNSFSSAGEAVLDELRLDGTYAAVRREALLHYAARLGLQPPADGPDRAAIQRQTAAFRSARGLFRQRAMADWATANDLDVAGLDQLIADRAAVELRAAELETALQPLMLDCLRDADRYVAMRDRARAKRECLVPRPTAAATPAKPVLLAWYFGSRLGQDIPDDLLGYARSIGLRETERFYSLLAAEYDFSVGPHQER